LDEQAKAQAACATPDRGRVVSALHISSPATVTGIWIERIANRKIVERWGEIDMLGVMLLPMAPSAIVLGPYNYLSVFFQVCKAFCADMYVCPVKDHPSHF